MSDTEFLEYVQSGGQVEATDELPDDYRAKLIKFIECTQPGAHGR